MVVIIDDRDEFALHRWDLVQNVRILSVHIMGGSYLRTYTPASASLSCVAISSDDTEEMVVLREHFFGSAQPRLLNLIGLPRQQRDPSDSPMALEPLCTP